MFRIVVFLSIVFILATSCRGNLEGTAESEPSQNPPPVATASFVAFGDWGSGDENQEAVAAAIGGYCGIQPCEFVLTLGDNFYDEGVESVDDPLWEEVYRDVYGSLGLPFYAVLGNHDTKGNIQAQIDYSEVDSSWHMPAAYYSFARPSSSPFVEFFVLNSDDLDQDQRIWLGRTLSESQAAWKILVMHHPVYSNGNHGDDDAGNNEDLLPIICNRIDLVVSGHDHNFAYLRSDEDGCSIEQLVIGTGGAGLRDVDEEDLRVVATGSFYGFGWFQVTPTTVTFRMIKTDGQEFYSTSFQSPR